MGDKIVTECLCDQFKFIRRSWYLDFRVEFYIFQYLVGNISLIQIFYFSIEKNNIKCYLDSIKNWIYIVFVIEDM